MRLFLSGISYHFFGSSLSKGGVYKAVNSADVKRTVGPPPGPGRPAILYPTGVPLGQYSSSGGTSEPGCGP